MTDEADPLHARARRNTIMERQLAAQPRASSSA